MRGFPRISPLLKKRASRIQVILMDVDGTMTDGSVTLLSQNDGNALEIKTFDAHDGQGLTLAHTAGIRTGCITGRESAALLRRCVVFEPFDVCRSIAVVQSGRPRNRGESGRSGRTQRECPLR